MSDAQITMCPTKSQTNGQGHQLRFHVQHKNNNSGTSTI